jgi:hypothetical protein
MALRPRSWHLGLGSSQALRPLSSLAPFQAHELGVFWDVCAGVRGVARAGGAARGVPSPLHLQQHHIAAVREEVGGAADASAVRSEVRGVDAERLA